MKGRLSLLVLLLVAVGCFYGSSDNDLVAAIAIIYPEVAYEKLPLNRQLQLPPDG